MKILAEKKIYFLIGGILLLLGYIINRRREPDTSKNADISLEDSSQHNKEGAQGHMEDLTKIVLESLSSIIPIILILLAFNKFVLKVPLENPRAILIGLVLSTIGLVIFSLGLRLGMMPLGDSVGANLAQCSSVWVVLLFGFIVGFAVTLAEPSLQALGYQVEDLSAGIVKKQTVVLTVALGVGLAVTIGLLKIIFHIPLVKIVVPGFILAAIFGSLAPKTMLGVAFDAGGVTTGPVTVPIIVALGVGLASTLSGRDPLMDGFGMVTLAYLVPIFSVLILSIIYKL